MSSSSSFNEDEDEEKEIIKSQKSFKTAKKKKLECLIRAPSAQIMAMMAIVIGCMAFIFAAIAFSVAIRHESYIRQLRYDIQILDGIMGFPLQAQNLGLLETN